uniref:LRRCT domain-containing protein n=1 Tax=Oreochromis aureus TaxID=47969 RepID=A0A668TXF6_OREAU
MLWCRCGVLLALCICPLACLAVSPCPTGCCCPRPGFLVLCESLGLRSLPRSVPLSTSLSLSHNLLARFPRGLPPNLSENCISALDLPSLSALVNLQVLKINSNCLRSVPESAFDSLPRLRSVDLTNNLWVCECDILYLYRWLLSGRLKMATDIVCTEPDHLAHRLLLNLSVVAICPRVLKPNDRTHERDLSSAQERTLTAQPAEKISKLTTNGLLFEALNSNQDSPKTPGSLTVLLLWHLLQALKKKKILETL